MSRLHYLYTHEGLVQVEVEHDYPHWTPECPNCGSRKTRYHSTAEFRNWYCTQCGLTEAPFDEWIGKPEAREIFYG